MYTLEFLEKTFAEHVVMAKEQNRITLEEFKKNYPDDPIPAWMTNDFSIPLALGSICKEVMQLKGKLADKEKTSLEQLADLGLLGAIEDSEVTSDNYKEYIKEK